MDAMKAHCRKRRPEQTHRKNFISSGLFLRPSARMRTRGYVVSFSGNIYYYQTTAFWVDAPFQQ